MIHKIHNIIQNKQNLKIKIARKEKQNIKTDKIKTPGETPFKLHLSSRTGTHDGL